MEIFDYFLVNSNRTYFIYLFIAYIIAILFFHKKYTRLGIFTHKSSLFDYGYFVFIFLIKFYIIIPLIFAANEVSIYIALFLEDNFGYIQSIDLSRTNIAILYTFCLFIISDFSRYFLHRFMHTYKFLWYFHKLHHSAKRLNPLTFYRIHPIESLLFALRYSIVAGLVSGIFIYLFKANVQLIDLFGINIFLFISHILGDNLRHSHVPLSYPKSLEKILISPRQHQIHHARNPKFFNSNYGGVLAIWDYMFNTISYSKYSKAFFYGIVK